MRQCAWVGKLTQNSLDVLEHAKERGANKFLVP